MDKNQEDRIIKAIRENTVARPSTIFDDIAGDTDLNSDAISVQGANISLWGRALNLDAVEPDPTSVYGTVLLKGCNYESVIDAEWIDLPDGKLTFNTNDDGKGSGLVACPYAFVKLFYQKGTNSVATSKVKVIINQNK